MSKENKYYSKHCKKCNRRTNHIEIEKFETCKKLKERKYLQEKFGFNLDKYSGVDKRLLLRNCVVPELGLHILKQVENCSQSITNPKTDLPLKNKTKV